MLRLVSLPATVWRAIERGGRRVGALLALAQGRWRLYRRDADGAVLSLDVAARRAPDSFSPWLHLARAHLRRRDWVGARQALARARELAPERFASVAVRALEGDGFRIAALSEPVSVTPEASAPGGSAAAQGPTAARAERTAVRARAQEGPAAHPLGDCRDLDEYARFRSMPPISAAERESVDWDAVADDLLDG